MSQVVEESLPITAVAQNKRVAVVEPTHEDEGTLSRTKRHAAAVAKYKEQQQEAGGNNVYVHYKAKQAVFARNLAGADGNYMVASINGKRKKLQVQKHT